LFQPSLDINGIGNARQTAINSLSTPFGIWLDSDDEYLPFRIEKIISDISGADYDFFFDSASIVNGTDGKFIRDAIIPDQMFYNDGKYFLLERNYLPGPSWNFFKTQSALAVGYDCTGNEIAEDHDFNLRALQQGFEFGFSKNITYKQKSFPGSFSRDIDAQLLRTRNAISKLNSDSTINLLWSSNLATPNKISILLHYYLLRLEFCNSKQLLEDHKDTFIKYLKSEYYFYWGNIALHETAHDESIAYYSEALKISEKPELYNNLACAHHRLENFDLAKYLLKKAVTLFPEYYDAQKNLIEFDSGNPLRITPFKIRKSPNRHEYYLENED